MSNLGHMLGLLRLALVLVLVGFVSCLAANGDGGNFLLQCWRCLDNFVLVLVLAAHDFFVMAVAGLGD